MCERARASVCACMYVSQCVCVIECVCQVALCSTGPATFSVQVKFCITLSKLRTSKHFYKAASFNEA